MDTPKFVGVVVSGAGNLLSIRKGDTQAETEGKTMETYNDEMAAYEAMGKKSELRPADPPMWDVYERIRPTPTVVHPPNQTAAD